MNATGPKKRAFAFALSLLLVLQMLVPSASLQAIAEEVAGEVPVAVEAAMPTEAAAPETVTSEDDAPDQDDAPGQDGAEEDTVPEHTVPLAREASWVTVGNFAVMGGTQGTDYELSGTTLHIKTSTPLTVRNADGVATATQNIQVDAGVKADLTLAGVTISYSAAAPIELVTNSDPDGDGVKVTNADQIVDKTTLYLTLADGTTNNLTCTNEGTTGSPAIRCGWGSVLVIDDSVPNVRAGGSKFDLDDIVTPEGGMVPYDVTLLDGTVVSKGDPLVNMTPSVPGALNCQGGGHSAGIGSAANENAGTLVFNGGTIVSRVCRLGAGWGNANGAGIGSGSGGSGTVMVFNGGNVTAYASSCGAGIGSALGYFSADHINGVPKADAIPIPNGEALSGGYSFIARPDQVSWFCCKTTHQACPYGVHYIQGATSNNYFTVAGDITVNGGFISANSGQHGNAFGQSCAHGPSTNRNHIVRVTGGTLLTSTNDITSGDPPRAALGASFGYTIVTGGSVQLGLKNGKPAFQGLGDTAYNTTGVEDWSDVESRGGSLPDTDKVQMLTIDLSSEFAAGENKTVPVSKWKLEIANQVQDYGAPSYLNDGKLYLWLPESATGKNVTVTMSYLDNNGQEHDIEPMYVEEVGGSQGSTLKRYIDIDVDSLTDEQKAYFSGLEKPYDGLPFSPLTISASKPIEFVSEQGNHYTLYKPEDVTTSYQPFVEKGGSPVPGSVVTTGTTMPADTGIYRVQLVSKQYATDEVFKSNYWGHRITAWAVIDPVPAVLTMDGVEWGNLADDGTWTPVTEDSASSGVAGNRLRLRFNIRSANTTALTCASPTGSFQVSIDGDKVGDPIALTKEAVEASPYSTITWDDLSVDSATGGKETRHGTEVVYYFDPTNNDALLKALEDASRGGEHTVNVEYIADKNYIEGVDKNPENAKEDDTFIVPVPPETTVEPDPDDKDKVDIKEEDLDPSDPDNPNRPTDPSDPDNPGGDPAGPDGPAPGVAVVHKTVTLHYGDYKDKTLGLTFGSSSSMPMTCRTSNEAVAELVAGDDGSVLDENGKVNLQVNSCGITRIVMEQPANALYTGTKVILDVRVIPDPQIKPKVQVRLVTRNLTRPGEPARPGDEIEYLVTGMNLVNGSAWQTAKLLDTLDPRLELVDGSVSITDNYATPDVSTRLGTDEFYAAAAKDGFSWDDFDWGSLAMEQGTGEGQYTFDEDASRVTASAGTVYGGQSVTMRFTARLASGTADRPKEPGDPKDIVPGPGGEGSYGHSEDPKVPDEVHTLDPANPDDILVVGDDPKADPDNPDDPDDPNNPDNPAYDPNPEDPGTIPPLPIIPKDPQVGPDPDDPDAEPDISVGKTAENLTHPGAKRAMVGDEISYTVTLSNKGVDTAWYSPVIRDTLPEGLEYKPGTLVLTRVDGTEQPVSDDVYVEKTRTIAVYVDDLYGGESTSLTFTCVVTPDAQGTEGANVAHAFGQTPSDRWKEEHPDPSPEDPDDPDNPGGDPSDPGENPGGDPGDPDDPDNPGGKPSRPEPGDPFVPEPPAGTDPDDPDYDPWDGFDWDEYPGGDTPTPRPSDPVTPGPAGGVMPADPAEDGLAMSLTGENLTRDISRTMVGDTIRYTATFTNTQDHTALYDTVLRNEVPAGLTVVPGSIFIEVPDTSMPMALRSRAAGVAALALDGDGAVLADPEPVDGGFLRYAVDDGALSDGTVGVRCGVLPAGSEVRLTFDAVVGPSAAGRTIVDRAWGHGMLPSRYDHDGEQPKVSSAFQPATTLAAFLATEGLRTLPATHEIPVSEVVDPEDGAVTLTKRAENLTTAGGDTYVGDRVLYTLTLSNGTPGSVVYDAVIEDTVPAGLSVDESTVRLVTADGRTVSCRGVYDAATRRLSVVAGDVAGGRSATLAFEAVVTAEAVGADVGNVARAFGTLPSRLPDGERTPLVPGTRFDPPAGWEAFLSDSGSLSVSSGEAVYPSANVTAREGVKARVLPVTGGRGVVPVTGDVAGLTGALGVAAAAVTVLAAHLRRRR